jgi:hypothetical protein
MKIKTSELTGAALDWAVAECAGLITRCHVWFIGQQGFVHDDAGIPVIYSPSTNWAQGGPIIEREKIRLEPCVEPDGWGGWMGRASWYGETPLIAAMRCYVASKLGYEVEVPDELA